MSMLPAPAWSSTETVAVGFRGAVTARLADYFELAKPRISVLVLLTVTAGFGLASPEGWELARLCHALLGVALVATGSTALNQWLERRTDARMLRTAHRPLPDGRLLPAEVLALGIACGLCGAAWLAVFVNLQTAGLAALTYLLYVGAYTPLKRVTACCTAVGAIPGALPPVLGWTAAGGALDMSAFTLFALLFLWQFPHFLAIAWLYREDYARAGLRMLPALRPARGVTGLMALVYCLALVPVSLLPEQVGLAGSGYFLAALVAGCWYLAASVRFMRNECTATARGLLWASLAYLPLVLVALVADHWWLLSKPG